MSKGQALAEYVILAAILAAVSMGAMGLFKKALAAAYNNTASSRCGPAGIYP
jgi:hypothetical protein